MRRLRTLNCLRQLLDLLGHSREEHGHTGIFAEAERGRQVFEDQLGGHAAKRELFRVLVMCPAPIFSV